MIRHVRKSNANVRDQRFRSREFYPNKMRPTLCGADPTIRDRARSEAAHVVRCAAVPRLAHWLDDMCPQCLAALKEAV